MSDCCGSSKAVARSVDKRSCPANGKVCSPVSLRTILHHIKTPWKWMAENQNYYFCDDPECEVAYFGENGETINKSELRTHAGLSIGAPETLLCYCFGVSRTEAQTNLKAKEFVLQMTRNRQCSCETSNPSGRCCLKDFPDVSD